MGYFSVFLFIALILLFLFVLFPIFLRECIFGFISFSLFFTLYFFISSSVFSLFISFLLGGSLVLVQVKQVRGFYRVFIIKNKGEWGVCTRGSNYKKKNE